MKKVEAIIRHNKLEEVKDQLARRVIAGMTVTEVRGYGNQVGQVDHTYRGNAFETTNEFLPKVKVEIVCPDNFVPSIVDIITQVARTGQLGDGKIFISDLTSVIRIRTNDSNENAI